MRNRHQATASAVGRCLLLFACLLWATPGCQPSAPPAGPETRFPLALGDQVVLVQLALGPQESARGLMGRTHLQEDEGMLFISGRAGRQSFWMKNTPLPLDIGFFCGEGVLREVRQMFPYDETPVLSGREDIQFALEMNQGWFALRRVEPGARLDLAGVERAIRSRSQDPRQVLGRADP